MGGRWPTRCCNCQSPPVARCAGSLWRLQLNTDTLGGLEKERVPLKWTIYLVIACGLAACRTQSSPSKAGPASPSTPGPTADGAEAKFWQWFQENDSRLFGFERDRDKVFDDLGGAKDYVARSAQAYAYTLMVCDADQAAAINDASDCRICTILAAINRTFQREGAVK